MWTYPVEQPVFKLSLHGRQLTVQIPEFERIVDEVIEFAHVAASRPKFSARTIGCPAQPMASARCWSEKRKSMLGRVDVNDFMTEQ